MTTIKIDKTKIYLNSLVDNPEKYFSASTKPIDAEIVDASFVRNGEEENFITGLWNYYENGCNNALGHMEKEFINKKYSGISLRLFVKEKKTGHYANILLDDLNEIAEHLAEISREELSALEKMAKSMSKSEFESEKWRLKEKRDSCLPLINQPIKIYRQSVNGRDVIGLSKAYNPTVENKK